MTTILNRRARLVACAAISAVALAVAGCGGGNGGGSASKKDFEAATNQFCKDVTGAAQQVQKDASSLSGSAAKDPKKAVQQLSGALGTFASSTKSALDKYRSVDTPGDYKAFHDAAVKGFDTVVTKLQQAATAAKSGDVQAISALGTSLNGIKLPDPPKELKDNAPACSNISS